VSIERFEDLIAWQKTRELTRNIYALTQQGQFVRDFGLSNQMQRAAVSIISNIAEGFERETSGEFQHFLVIAKASCGELRSQLYVALDIGYLPRADFDGLIKQSIEVSRIIAGLRASVISRGNDKRK
jgi:four helix bundle protein